MAALCLMFDYVYGSPSLRAAGLLTVGFCFACVGKIWLLKRSRYGVFVVMLWLELSAFGLGLALTSYLALPIVVLYPVIMYVCSSAFASSNSLKWVVVWSLSASVTTFVIGLFFTTTIAQPWYLKTMVIGGALVTQILVLILAWQSRLHQIELLTQSESANVALQQLRNQLKHTVAERTSELARTVSLLRATLDATTDGIVVIDLASHVTISNRKFIELWQIAPEFIHERDANKLLFHVRDQLADPEGFVQQVQQIYQTPEAETQDVLLFKDGRILNRYSQPQKIDNTIVGRVWSFRDVTQQTQAEERAHAFATLGKELSVTVTVEDAARTIIATADALFGWDACYLDFYYPENQTLKTIVCIDTFGDQRVDMPLPPASTISFTEHRIIRQGSQLILREPEDPGPADLVAFGDLERPSASLMFAPILRGDATIGVLSIQSYTHNAYTEADLDTFQNLANHCAGALERIRTEEALHKAREERQELEVRMLETQKRESLGLLAGGIAHDFNNLLTVIQGNIGLARFDLEHDSPALESLQQADLAARRAADLTRQMLAYAGKGQLATDRLALNNVLHEMRDLLHALLPKHVRFDYQLDPRLPWVEADPTQVRQVIMNLLVNASEAIGDAYGEVTVRTRVVDVAASDLAEAAVGSDAQPGTYVALEVDDTGSGMDSTTARRIFEPFFSTKFTGRGLGLAAVLGIVRSHHGAIRVCSEVGRGTQFQVLLPPATPPAAIAPAEQLETHWHGYGDVIIIDDEPAIRTLISRMVRQLGFTPQIAEDGGAGIATVQATQGQLALVMLDLTMPGKSAQQILAESTLR